jgi:annexin A7/11
MDSVVRGELSMKTQRAFEIVLQGRWEEGTLQTRIDKDVHDLAGAMRTGCTDEMLVCSILFTRSPTYLASLSAAFQDHTKKTLEKVIKDNFQGHLESALVFAAKGGNSVQRSVPIICQSSIMV